MELINFSNAEKSRYLELKKAAKNGWLLFTQSIIEIRDSKLYRIEHQTFEDFCLYEVGITKTHAYRLIEAAEITENIKKSPMGDFPPSSERQTRPLTKIEPKLQPIVWADVVRSNEKVTAKAVQEKADEYEAINEALQSESKIEINIFNPNPQNKIVSERLAAISQMPMDEQIKAVKEMAKEIRTEEVKEKVEARKIEILKQIEQIESGELPELKGVFDIISVDPPWNYGREYNPETSRVANPYPEMPSEEIKKIQLPTAENAIVFLWTTHRFLPDAFDILKTWGLEYKACLVWDKEKIGMGAWFRMQCEFCLVAIKGKPFWNNTTERDIIRESRREHSRKPDAFFDIIDKICVGRKLEYFSREARIGWEIFGNDINKF